MEEVKPGKTVWWLLPKNGVYNECKCVEDAITELLAVIQQHPQVTSAVVNTKSSDGEFLDVIQISRNRYPKRK